MPKHQVIRDAGQSLLGVLRAELSAQKSKAKAYLAAPAAEFLRKNVPCLVLYLYDIRPSVDVRTNESWHLEEEVTDEKGETAVLGTKGGEKLAQAKALKEDAARTGADLADSAKETAEKAGKDDDSSDIEE